MDKNIVSRLISPKVAPLPIEDEKLDAVASLAKRRFRIGSRTYEIDFPALAKVAKLIVDSARSGDEPFFVAHLIREARIDVIVEVEAESSYLLTIPPLILHESGDWPHDKIMAGIVVILGDMFSGKTYYITHKKGVDFIVRYGEPVENVDYQDNVIPASTFASALAYSLVLGLAGYRVALDSIRRVVYGLSGAAMKGGITSSFFDVLTDINNIVHAIGATVLVAVNPMLADTADMDRMFRRVGASTCGAVWLEDGDIKEETYRLEDGRFIGVTGEKEDKKKDDGPRSSLLNMLSLEEGEYPNKITADFGEAMPDLDEEKSNVRDFPDFNI